MKKLFLLVTICALSSTLRAQTIISPSIGIDYTKMQDPDRNMLDYLTILISDSKYTSLNANLSIEKYLNKKFTLGFNASLSRKSVIGVPPNETFSRVDAKVTYYFLGGQFY